MATSKKRKRSNDIVSCDICPGLTYCDRQSLRRHCKKHHPQKHVEINNSQICIVCEEKFPTLKQLQDHISNCHEEINLSFEKKIFYSEYDFLSWKESTEQNSMCNFIIKTSKKKHEEGIVTKYYLCSRSGSAKPKVTDRKRVLRESVKCGYTCPAAMKVVIETVNEAQLVTVEYQSVHLGHDLGAEKMRLTKNMRSELAAMLEAGLKDTEVLDKVQQERFTPKKVSQQDLYNVKRDFLVNKNFFSRDSKSVENMVQEIKEANAVLIYKPIDQCLDVYPGLKKDEFLLGIMNDDQKELFEFYGEHYVMVDSTSTINHYKYHLTIIFVHDENYQHYPIAVLFSTRTTTETFDAFFAEIKKKCPSFKTKFIVSIDNDIFYNSWRNVFGVDTEHILFNWQLKHNLGFHLIAKVKDKNVRNQMRKDLFDILKEPDVITFDALWNNFFKDHESEETFLSYLKIHYETRKRNWAHCYTKVHCINTTRKFQRWHKLFKRSEKEGDSFLQKLEPTLNLVLQEIAKIFLERISATEQGGWTPRMDLIRRSHTSSVMLEPGLYSVKEIIPNEKWVVSENVEQSTSSYEVNASTVACSCDIICPDCEVCIKQRTCTCVDYNVKYIICKHIHYVCMYFSVHIIPTTSQIYINDLPYDVQLVVDVENISIEQHVQNQVIIAEVQTQSPDQVNEEEEEKKSVIADLKKFRTRVQKLKSRDQLRFVKEQIAAMNSYLDATSSKTTASGKNTPSNQTT